MENKDTNTDYEKVLTGQKVRNCRNYSQYHFFCLRFVFTIFFTRSFQVPPEKKSPPPEVLTSTQNPNLS